MMYEHYISSFNLPIVGCAENGRIDYLPEATDEQRAVGEQARQAWLAMTAEQQVAASEQARLQAVAVRLAAPLAEFATAWAKTGIESVPDSWNDAIILMRDRFASLATIEEQMAHMMLQQELIVLRFGALAADWDDVLKIINGGAI